MKRLSVSLPPEIEKTIIDLRKTDEFCMCSCADILRKLMLIGAEQLHTSAEQAEGRVRGWKRLWKMLRKTQPPSLLTVWSS